MGLCLCRFGAAEVAAFQPMLPLRSAAAASADAVAAVAAVATDVASSVSLEIDIPNAKCSCCVIGYCRIIRMVAAVFVLVQDSENGTAVIAASRCRIFSETLL